MKTQDQIIQKGKGTDVSVRNTQKSGKALSQSQVFASNRSLEQKDRGLSFRQAGLM